MLSLPWKDLAKNLHAGVEILQSQGPKTAPVLLLNDIIEVSYQELRCLQRRFATKHSHICGRLLRKDCYS